MEFLGQCLATARTFRLLAIKFAPSRPCRTRRTIRYVAFVANPRRNRVQKSGNCAETLIRSIMTIVTGRAESAAFAGHFSRRRPHDRTAEGSGGCNAGVSGRIRDPAEWIPYLESRRYRDCGRSSRGRAVFVGDDDLALAVALGISG